MFSGAECNPGQTRCLIRLSNGGGDAVVLREYDLKALKLATDGFALAEAKSDATYLNDDTVLYSTALDGATTSILCPHRQAMASRPTAQRGAQLLQYEGPASDVGASAGVFHVKTRRSSAW